MIIGFTGHRDRQCDPTHLDKLAQKHPDAIWIHGGAIGFDAQVQAYATQHGISTAVIKPDYKRHGTNAPLVRNRDIVDLSEALVACYDGREKSGTGYTIDYAKQRGLPVWILKAYPLGRLAER